MTEVHSCGSPPFSTCLGAVASFIIGRDSEYVYTVEGNSGDAVKCKQYRIGSSVIYGFGLMNY